MISLIIPDAVRKGYKRSATCSIHTRDSPLSGTPSLCLQTWRNDAAASVLILAGIFDLVLVFILRRKCLIVLVTF